MDTGTIIIAVATVVTGMATCVSAFVAWDAWRGRIAAEWDACWSHDRRNGRGVLEVTPTIVNGTRTTIQATRVTVTPAGFVDNVLTGNPPMEKHESWPRNEAPLSSKIEPLKRASARIIVQPDWPALSDVTPRWWWPRRWRRVPAALRIKVTVVSRSARSSRRRFSTKIHIVSEQIAEAMINT